MAAHKRTFMQKGLFHQGIHQAAAIYTVYCRGFPQALQVALGEKRVTGDLVKGGFQDHDKI